jgi:hypothetical protein
MAALFVTHHGIHEYHFGFKGIDGIGSDALSRRVSVENACRSKGDAGRHGEMVNGEC